MKLSLPVIFLFIIAPVIFCNGQNKIIDSLTQSLSHQKEDAEKVRTQNMLSVIYFKMGDYDHSMSYANAALTLAKKIGFQEGISEAYNCIGFINTAKGNHAEAMTNINAAISIKEKIDDKPGLINSYINLGNIYYQQGNFPKAIENFFVSLRIAEETGSKQSIAKCYNNIGNVYFQQANYTEAMKCHLSVLKTAQELNDGQLISVSYNNIGNIYFQQADYENALKNYQSALKIKEATGEKIGIVAIYGNISNVLMKQNKIPAALEMALKASKIAEETEDRNNIASTYSSIGSIYMKQKKNQEAYNYLSKSLAIANEIGNRDLIKEVYMELSQLDSINGNFQSAYQYYKLYSVMKDSLFNEQTSKQISQLQVEYESEKKDRKIKIQELKNRELQIRFYIAAAMGLAIIAFLYTRSRRKKREFENKITGLELTVLKSQLNPHFVFNCLHSIKSFIDTNPETGADYLNRFSLLMRGVLEKNEEKEISLDEEMKLMEHYIELEKMRLSGKLNYSITYNPFLNKEETMIPPLITQPIIENAIWHSSISEDECRHISIHNSVSGKTLTVTVTNNNAGVQPEKKQVSSKRKSFGIKITRERLALLKKTIGREGTCNLEIYPGETKATLIIPLKEF